MTWADGTIYALDTETTGVDVFYDRIVTATVVKVENGAAGEARTWLADPGIAIPQGATDIHGITDDHARENGRPAAEVIAEVAATGISVLRAGRPLIVFNAAFDLSILEAECRRHSEPSLVESLTEHAWCGVIDPMVLGKGIDARDRAFRKGRRYKLVDLCDRYKVPFTESHDATADATGAALLAKAIADSEDHLGAMGPRELHTLQQTWRRADQKNFRDWVNKNGRADEFGDIDSGWPLHSKLIQQEVPA